MDAERDAIPQLGRKRRRCLAHALAVRIERLHLTRKTRGDARQSAFAAADLEDAPAIEVRDCLDRRRLDTLAIPHLHAARYFPLVDEPPGFLAVAGSGELAAALSSAGYDVVAIDPASENTSTVSPAFARHSTSGSSWASPCAARISTAGVYRPVIESPRRSSSPPVRLPATGARLVGTRR